MVSSEEYRISAEFTWKIQQLLNRPQLNPEQNICARIQMIKAQMKSSSHGGETDGWRSGFAGLWGIRSLLLDRIGRGLTCWIVNVASQAGGWLAEGADTSRVMSWLALEQHPSSSQLIIWRRRSRRSRARTFARVHGRPAGSRGLSRISALRAKSDGCESVIDAFHRKRNQICGAVERRREFALRQIWMICPTAGLTGGSRLPRCTCSEISPEWNSWTVQTLL